MMLFLWARARARSLAPVSPPEYDRGYCRANTLHIADKYEFGSAGAGLTAMTAGTFPRVIHRARIARGNAMNERAIPVYRFAEHSALFARL